MGSSKSLSYEVAATELAQFAKALGHPARVAIIQVLLTKRSCVCGTIVDEIGLSQSTISQHLKELREAGIIKGEIDGPRTCYCIDPEIWEKAKACFSSFFDSYAAAASCC